MMNQSLLKKNYNLSAVVNGDKKNQYIYCPTTKLIPYDAL